MPRTDYDGPPTADTVSKLDILRLLNDELSYYRSSAFRLVSSHVTASLLVASAVMAMPAEPPIRAAGLFIASVVVVGTCVVTLLLTMRSRLHRVKLERNRFLQRLSTDLENPMQLGTGGDDRSTLAVFYAIASSAVSLLPLLAFWIRMTE